VAANQAEKRSNRAEKSRLAERRVNSIPEACADPLDFRHHFLEVFHHATMKGGGSFRIFLEDTPEQPPVDLQEFQIGQRRGAREMLGFGDQRKFPKETSGFCPANVYPPGFALVKEADGAIYDDASSVRGFSLVIKILAGRDPHILRTESEEP
jgi:hypothetical protein